ncbi:3-hydroxyacyl-ACP dehydratase FabZ family protein [Polyangium aurulentum]|uniref:3-hydroxyacyl-ACP dehydratase FabZ family protein n=1 Tax=Polyangium aurulentum TaxID=2567896 RepID=UPI00146BD7CB|nr:3-hydroxyacyl-ACP dehydratase FabZ family protein [Polyangium aurulentum]UQA59164.1 beta-hydroxyacyl-ACP dehydratase [Polyangium aurulentum]
MRYVLLDRITRLEPPRFAAGVKCVSLSDDAFADHFPGHPVMPGALIVEALAQLGGVLLEQTRRAQGAEDVHALLTMVDRARFRRLVRPGDKLELEAEVLVVREEGGQIKATARESGEPVTTAELGFAFVKVTNPIVLARRREVLNIWLTGSAEEP